MMSLSADVLIVGSGPAGIASAVCAAETSRRVVVLDDNPTPGGQIWRGEHVRSSTTQAAAWFQRFQNTAIEKIAGARVISGNDQKCSLLVETERGAFEIHYGKLILATGARELFLPFPGWTLPNVMGVGGLQALVKSGLPAQGKRIVVAGSGPLLLAVAAYLRQRGGHHGAIVPFVAEQADWRKIRRFGLQLVRHPAKLWQAFRLRSTLGKTRYLTGCWVESAHGDNQVRQVRLRRGSRTWTEECDYLAVAYGFWPNVELATLLGCEISEGAVRVNDFQRTSLENIYCCGESTGIGGVDLSLVEGEIAGYAVTGRIDRARRLLRRRRQASRFANALNQAFVPRDELRALPNQETTICRCEDVSLGSLQSANSWRAAKLHFRCGMGPCQGRICGPAVQFLFGWRMDSVRPPAFPARVGTLLTESFEPKEYVI